MTGTESDDKLALARARLSSVELVEGSSHSYLTAVCKAISDPGDGGWTKAAVERLRNELLALLGESAEEREAQDVAVRTVSATLSMLASVPPGQLDSPYMHEVLHMLQCVLDCPWVLA